MKGKTKIEENNHVQEINIELNIPDNKEFLKSAEMRYEKIRNEYNEICSNDSIDSEKHLKLYESTMVVLDYVGDLSLSLQEFSPIIKDKYDKIYRNAPELAKLFWGKHYSGLHKEYNKIKNVCYNFLDELDDAYMRKYNKCPDNWNI